MIKVENMSYSFPEKDLYNKVSFTIEEDKHCAFIGTNGTGKSTLVQMLLDPDNYLFDGKISMKSLDKIGYVSQFSALEDKSDQTVFEYISEEFVHQQNHINELCTQLEAAEDFETILEEYQTAMDEFQAIDGDFYESNIGKQLKVADLVKLRDQKINTISNGEFKLVQVIREMLLNPKMLIMDEPDVFLDFERLNALRDLINWHKGTLLVITHNRYLLNHCFDKILHLEDRDIQEFNGNYVEYMYELLAAKIDMQEANSKEEEEIERNQALVNKIRAKATAMDNASLGRQVHARQTHLDRLRDRQTKAPFVEIQMPEISFAVSENEVEGPMLQLQDYEVMFSEQLLEHIDFEMQPGDKVAIVGRNGTGKTTLLRDIYEQKKDSIKFANQVEMAMFTQDLEDGILPIDLTTLSGGEKDLAQLEYITNTATNLLLLDEPTGHLDIYAQIALEQAIEEYPGAVLMVSHDFYTVANCMDYVLLVEDKGLRKMSIRKFRQMIYANYFDKDYLILEQQKKEFETRISQLLSKKDYEGARGLLEKLDEIIRQMK